MTVDLKARVLMGAPPPPPPSVAYIQVNLTPEHFAYISRALGALRANARLALKAPEDAVDLRDALLAVGEDAGLDRYALLAPCNVRSG